MMSVTDARWDRGRVDQKLRTRQALMDAAVELVVAGRHPSVATVADRAGVSRATAYRYFPSQDLMLSEAMVRAGARGDRELAAADNSDTTDAVEAAAAMARRAGQFALDHEERLRTALRLSLDPQSGYQRPGRRGAWIQRVLDAIGDRLDEPDRSRLAAALNLVVGVDAIVVLTDIAGLDRAEALDVLEWVATTLVAASLADVAKRSRRPSE
jgi:AcrR family transcriptional regulator